MGNLIGIDLGTSSVRSMIVSPEGTRLGVEGRSYEVSIPTHGAAEQDPDLWFRLCCESISSLLLRTGVDPSSIQGIGISGQMHGLVCLDANGLPLRPAMIWQDQRSAGVVNSLYESFGKESVLENTQNLLSPGFMGASLAWLRHNEPAVFKKIRHVLLPKDYVKYRLTGEITTDYSDAAGTGIFDNVSLTWSDPMLQALGLSREILPPISSSAEVIGRLTEEAAHATGVKPGTLVVGGGADQCMQAIGNGLILPGDFSVNIGTGGQVATIVSSPQNDTTGRTNLFAHVVEDRWNLMGATLSAGASLKWFAGKILNTNDFNQIDSLAEQTPVGAESLLFLPYLGGERTPLMDPHATGVFFGLTAKHGAGHLGRAVMEGVAYSLRNCLTVIRDDIGIQPTRMVVSGGGATSPLWRQILADVLQVPLAQAKESEQACLGAAATAGVGVGVYASFTEAVESLCSLERPVTEPRHSAEDLYDSMFGLFNEVYQQNTASFKALRKIASTQSA